MVNRKCTFLIVFMLVFPWGGSLFGGQCPQKMLPMNPDLHKRMVQAEKTDGPGPEHGSPDPVGLLDEAATRRKKAAN